MNIISSIIDKFEIYATQVPVEIFTFFGAFVEEVIAPIPSPVIMTLAGSVAAVQNHPVTFIFWLALIGAVGKTLGAWLLYLITDKAEDVIFKKFGRFLGVTHTQIEKWGKHFQGKKWDDVVLLIIRSLPIVPSAPISILAGFIKYPLKSFITWTFIGTIIRNLFFLYFGYVGISNFESVLGGIESVESLVQIGIAVTIVVFIGWIYFKRRQTDPIDWIKKKLIGKM